MKKVSERLEGRKIIIIWRKKTRSTWEYKRVEKYWSALRIE